MNIIIGNAWPYANGPLHLGRIAVLLPGDILARYHRMMGDEVVFLSGTDCHGTPVTMKAKEEGITPLEAVEKYHEEFKKCFKSLGFSFSWKNLCSTLSVKNITSKNELSVSSFSA